MLWNSPCPGTPNLSFQLHTPVTWPSRLSLARELMTFPAPLYSRSSPQAIVNKPSSSFTPTEVVEGDNSEVSSVLKSSPRCTPGTQSSTASLISLAPFLALLPAPVPVLPWITAQTNSAHVLVFIFASGGLQPRWLPFSWLLQLWPLSSPFPLSLLSLPLTPSLLLSLSFSSFLLPPPPSPTLFQ